MNKPILLVRVPGGWPDDAPPRSAFFGLAPEGYNGESYEDLSSYFRRTSAYQRIPPRALAMRALVPLFRDQPVHTLKRSYSDLTMNGVSDIAVAWVAALERLTLRTDLILRTLLPLRTVVPRFKLLSKIERFCPHCYADDERANRPKYNRLLWSIECVEACPLHNVLLEPVLGKIKPYTFWLPGLSRLDGSSLANHATREASEMQVKSARLVAELLDDIHQHPYAFENGDSPAEFLRHAINTMYDGRALRLANHLGVDNVAVYGWCSGRISPSLPRLVLIAYCCGCAVSDVILGNKVMLRRQSRPSDANPLVIRQRCGGAKPPEQLLADLERVFESGLARNLSHAARLLDVDEHFLRRLAPAIAARLVQRGRENRHREKIQREEARFVAFWQSFQELRSENIYPNDKKVRERMYQHMGRTLNFAEAGRFHKRALRLEKTPAARTLTFTRSDRD